MAAADAEEVEIQTHSVAAAQLVVSRHRRALDVAKERGFGRCHVGRRVQRFGDGSFELQTTSLHLELMLGSHQAALRAAGGQCSLCGGLPAVRSSTAWFGTASEMTDAGESKQAPARSALPLARRTMSVLPASLFTAAAWVACPFQSHRLGAVGTQPLRATTAVCCYFRLWRRRRCSAW